MSIPEGAPIRIREVWDQNARTEFQLINKLKHRYPTISVDTEFPGSLRMEPDTDVVFSQEEFLYQTLKANVDSMNLIQVGLTLTTELGELPIIDGAYCAWQFNLRDFDITSDLYVESSIQLLKASGIDFERNRREGIDSRRFGSLLVKYGLVCNSSVLNYVCYQGDYDFAYLLKVLTGEHLPSTRVEFKQMVQAYFGSVYDVRLVQIEHFKTPVGLQKFSDTLGIKRVSGAAHQAGSDSLLTSSAYHAIRQRYIEYCGGGFYAMLGLDTRTSVY